MKRLRIADCGLRISRWGARVRPGAALLEVVVALGILLMAMAMVGMAIRNSDRIARDAVEKSRALMLTEQLITYLDTGQEAFKDVANQREASGYFSVDAPPGWSWSVSMEKDPNVEGMERVTVKVIEGDPDAPEDEQRPLLVTHFLRAEKRNINLQEDFGMTEEQVTQITEAIPGGAALFDPTDFDPTSLARLDMDTLKEVLPMIMEQFGAMAGGLPGGMSPEQMMNQLQRDPNAMRELQGLAQGMQGRNNQQGQPDGSTADGNPRDRGTRDRFVNRRNGGQGRGAGRTNEQ